MDIANSVEEVNMAVTGGWQSIDLPAFTATKIIATIGPSSNKIDVMRSLILAGVSVFRLNFSHGDHQDHLSNIAKIRQLEQEFDRCIAILADLQGPKLRIGDVEEGVFLKNGQSFSFHLTPLIGNQSRAYLPHKDIFQAIQPGHHLLIDDGKLKLVVKSVTNDTITTEVVIGGALSSKKGVNVPDVLLPINALTDKDKQDLEFALQNDIRLFALSFVQTAADIDYLRKCAETKIHVVAKIEKPQALDTLESIVQAADAVMVARGDLAVELNPSMVPIAQRRITNIGRKYGKPVIIATQMLESMIDAPVPTRAEVSDVANAVFSGVDAVMLSAETAAGQFPVEAVDVMKNSIFEAEKPLEFSTPLFVDQQYTSEDSISDAVSCAVKELAQKLQCKTIASFTTTGSTSINIACERPTARLLALTTQPEVAIFLSLVWGTEPVLTDDARDFDEMVDIACRVALEKKLVSPKDTIVITAGVPFGRANGTNLLRIETLD